MRIAHVSSGLCRRSAGLGVAVAAISAATRSASNDVRVFGLSSPEWVGGDGATWAGAPATVFEPRSWSGPFGYAPDMLAAILDFNPDLVHLHGLWTYPSVAVRRWHQITGRPYLVSAHGMLMPASLEYSRFRKRLARSLFQDSVLEAAAALHATSADEEAAYRALSCCHRTELIPLAIEVIRLPGSVGEAPRRRALFLGRLHHQKGVDWLIEAWSRLEGDFPDWDLQVVGPADPAYVAEVERLKRMAARSRVSFCGPVYGPEKYSLLAAADIFLMPSRSENFGLTAAESLMMEVPVIASTGTPWSGLVAADAGWWIAPGAPALEDAMRDAMRLPRSELRRKGSNGRRWMEAEFSVEVMGRRWQDAYGRALRA